MAKNKYLSFEVDEKKTKIRNILNQDFLELELWMLADHEPNNNMSHFTLESMQDAIPTFYNKPILGSFTQTFGEKDGDFGGHDSELVVDEETEAEYFDNSGPNQEVPLGLITESSKVEIVKGSDGANWIKANGFLWVKYASKQILALLRRRKGRTKISVEVEVLSSYEDEETGIEHITKFNFLGVTCLGSYTPGKGLLGVRQEIHEGIEGANAKVLNFSKKPEFQKRLQKLTMAYETFEKSMNFKNSNNQNQNKEKNNFSEDEDIYHTNHPVNPDNEGYKEIGFEEPNTQPDEQEDNIDENNVNKENMSDFKGERKEKKFSMLTYNMKRQLLDSALSEAISNSFGGDRGYGWIQDFTDTECYFYLDCTGEEDGTYVAPYTITLTTENGEEKVQDCVIDFASKERAVQTWRKMSEEDGKGTEKNNMNKNNFNNDVVETPEDNGITIPEHFDDRNEEAPHSGDARGVAAPKSGDDRGVPDHGTHENHAADDQNDDKNDKEDTKETEAKDDTKDDNKPEKEDEAKNVTEVKTKTVDGKEVTEVVSKSVNAEENNKEEPKKETQDCDCDDDDDKDNKETEACDETEKECNYEAKFAQLSADYVAMQKENETLKAVNAKFESDIADLMSKVANFEADIKARHNNDMYTFGVNMFETEVDLSEDCRKSMSAELKTECDAGKFASEEEVKKFAVTKIAMALYEARKNQNGQTQNVENKSKVNNEKKEFTQNIAKPTQTVDALTASRMALEKLDEEE